MKHIFIINPVAGIADKTEQIRKLVSQRDDIEAIVFNTEDAGHEKELMKEMLDIFDDERVRIYICGGSGTLSNALDALDVLDMDHVEVGYYPCGLTNDFLKNFVEMGREFDDINAVIDGRPRSVDYMRCVVDGEDRFFQNEILFVTVGVAANIEKASKRLKLLGGISPTFMYILATIFTLPFSPAIDYEVLIDGEDYSREYKMIFVGNSPCLGGHFVPIRKEVSCNDGYLNVLLLKKIPALKSISYLTEFMHGNLPTKREEHATVLKAKEITFRRKDGKMLNINADGEIEQGNCWRIKVVHDKLKLIVPRQATFLQSAEELIHCLDKC